jgi:hypothetical protein
MTRLDLHPFTRFHTLFGIPHPLIIKSLDSSEVDTFMAPKGTNGKKESGRAKKAENEAIKRAATEDAKVRLSFYADILLPP